MSSGEMSVEEVKKHVRGYMVVFFALLCLTGVTVGLYYVHMPTVIGIIVALIVASIKAGLVAAYFMHLIEEKQIIYWLLMLTAVLFAFLMLINVFTFMR